MTRAGEHRWMVSYMDVLTVLLIFFLAAAANRYLPARPLPAQPPPAILNPRPPDPLEALEIALRGANLRLERTERGLSISLPQEVLFSPGDDKIHAAALPTLESIADALDAVPNRIVLAGHADITPIRNVRFRSNWELAASRSLHLLEMLTRHFHVDESRFSVASYGSSVPRSPNDTAEGRAANRRVEILVLK
jgi:chemotaxis protein MotB